MRLTSRRRLYLAGAAALAAAVVTGGALAIVQVASEDPGEGEPLLLAPRRGTIPTVPGTAQTVLATLDARFPLVRNVRVVTRTISAEPPNPPHQGLVLEYDLVVPSFDGPATVLARWQGTLLAGALADVYAARGFGALAGVIPTLVAPDGSRQETGGGSGATYHDQVFDDPAGIAATITARAPLFGLRDVRVSFVEGLQRAVVVTAVSDHPKRDTDHLNARGRMGALIGRPPADFEGTYLQVNDAAGAPQWISATAPRAASGLYWSAWESEFGSR